MTTVNDNWNLTKVVNCNTTIVCQSVTRLNNAIDRCEIIRPAVEDGTTAIQTGATATVPFNGGGLTGAWFSTGDVIYRLGNMVSFPVLIARGAAAFDPTIATIPGGFIPPQNTNFSLPVVDAATGTLLGSGVFNIDAATGDITTPSPPAIFPSFSAANGTISYQV